MTNEAAQLSPRQRHPLSPLTTLHSDSQKRGQQSCLLHVKVPAANRNCAVGLAEEDEDATVGPLSQHGPFFFWQAGKYFPMTRKGLAIQSEANSFRRLLSLPGVLALFRICHFVLRPSSKMWSELPEMLTQLPYLIRPQKCQQLTQQKQPLDMCHIFFIFFYCWTGPDFLHHTRSQESLQLYLFSAVRSSRHAQNGGRPPRPIHMSMAEGQEVTNGGFMRWPLTSPL